MMEPEAQKLGTNPLHLRPHSFLSSIKGSTAQCCSVEGPLAEIRRCAMVPVCNQCEENGVVTGVRLLAGQY